MTRQQLIDGIIAEEERAHDFIWKREKLERQTTDFLRYLYEESKHMIPK